MSSRYYSLGAGADNLRAVASFILESLPTDDPLALADVEVFVPAERMALSLRRMFLTLAQESGKQAAMLPTIRPLQMGEEEADTLTFKDLDSSQSALLDMPAPLSELGRTLLLSRLIEQHEKTLAQTLGVDGQEHKLDLTPQGRLQAAQTLSSLLGRLETYSITLTDLEELVPPELASHWQKNLAFLKLALTTYPQALEKRGMSDKSAYGRLLLEAEAQYIETTPHKTRYAVGFVDSTPPGLAVLKALKNSGGVFFFPALDEKVLEKYDVQGEEDTDSSPKLPATHHQYPLLNLLSLLDIQVADITPLTDKTERAEVWAQALRPAAQTLAWQHQDTAEKQRQLESLKGTWVAELDTPTDEVDYIAGVMARTLSDGQKTTALVTANRRLARRVAARLATFGVQVNDSGGESLLARPVGAFMQLLLGAARYEPLALASLLAHPFSRFGMSVADWKKHARAFDKYLLRGMTPRSLEGLKGRLLRLQDEKAIGDDSAVLCQTVLAKLAEHLAPLCRLDGQDKTATGTFLQAHIATAKAVCTDAAGAGSDKFLSDDDGRSLHDLFRLWQDDHSALLSFEDYAMTYESLASSTLVRMGGKQHPRAFIWGPLEARLQTVDTLILGGMNDGDWPNSLAIDPWLSGSMKRQLGLPPEEMAIALNGHDFYSLASSQGALHLTRAVVSSGEQTIPSRFLMRLEAFLGSDLYSQLKSWPDRFKRHLRDDMEAGQPAFYPRSAQLLPAQNHQPKVWSASYVRELTQCPYRAMLSRGYRLKKADPYEQAPDAALKGEIIHRILERFCDPDTGFSKPMVAENENAALAYLTHLATEEFAQLDSDAVRDMWQIKFERIAPQFIRLLREQFEDQRRVVSTERTHKQALGAVTLTAKIDRLDSTVDGLIALDYKTGSVPPTGDVLTGIEPQLAISGLVARAATGKDMAHLEYWQLSHDVRITPPEKPKNGTKLDVASLLDKAEAGIKAHADTFLGADVPYAAYPDSRSQGVAETNSQQLKGICRYCDFAHICRRKHWQENAPTQEAGDV